MLALTLFCLTVFAVGFVSRTPHERESAGPGADTAGIAFSVSAMSHRPSGPVNVGAVMEPGFDDAEGTAVSVVGHANPSFATVSPDSVTATSHGLYRHRSAAYWAWRYRQRTQQLQAAHARIRQLKLRLRQRHTSAATSTPTSSYGVWDRLANCESGGNWRTDTGNGFVGGLQFALGTWSSYGGTGMPNLASRDAQIAVAERVLAAAGGRFTDWPGCRAKLGLP